jgi:WD40 repeat protein
MKQQQDKDIFKYWAFISYSHNPQYRRWGEWLHRQLETYRVPRKLVGKPGRDGNIPRRCFPIFRDREELPTASDLGAPIRQALKESRTLIVICSPAAARSEWVNEEVKAYKTMGHADRLQCLIVAGEPNATDKPERELEECFPPAVRFHIDAGTGQLSSERTEPIAADVRPGMDGKVNAKLKLVAGILGINFDELKQRERRRRRKRLLVISSFLLMIAASAVGLWRFQEGRAKRALEHQRKLQDAAQAEETGRKALLVGDFLAGAQALARACELDPARRSVHLMLGFAFRAVNGLRFTTPTYDSVVRRIEVDTNGRSLLSVYDNGQANVSDPVNGRLLRVISQPTSFPNNRQTKLSPDGQHVLFFEGEHCFLEEVKTGRKIEIGSFPLSQFGTMMFSRDGTSIFGSVPSAEGRLQLISWNTVDGKEASRTSVIGEGELIGTSVSGQYFVVVVNDSSQQSRKLIIADRATGAVHVSIPVVAYSEIAMQPGGDLVLVFALAFALGEPAQVYSADTGKALFSLQTKDVVPARVRWTPSGKRIISFDQTGGVTTWDSQTGRPLHHYPIRDSAAATTDEKDTVLAIFSRNGEISVFDLNSGSLLRRFKDQIGWKDIFPLYMGDSTIAFTPGARLLMSGANSGAVKSWDWRQTISSSVRRDDDTLKATSAVFDSTGSKLLTATEDGRAVVWDASTGQKQLTIGEAAPSVNVKGPIALFSPDNTKVLTGGSESSAKLWNAQTGVFVAALDFDKKGIVLGDTIHVDLSHRGDRCVAMSNNGSGVLWDPGKSKSVKNFASQAQGTTKQVSFSTDGNEIMVVRDEKIEFLNAETGENVASLSPVGYRFVRGGFSSDGRMLFALDQSGIVGLWTTSGLHLRDLAQINAQNNDAEFSPNGAVIVTACSDNHLRLWNCSSGAVEGDLVEEKPTSEDRLKPSLGPPIDLTGPGQIVRTGFTVVAFSPTGRWVAGGNDKGVVCLWDTETRKQLLRWEEHQSSITTLTFSGDGGRLAAVGADGTVTIWDVSEETDSPKEIEDQLARLRTARSNR